MPSSFDAANASSRINCPIRRLETGAGPNGLTDRFGFNLQWEADHDGVGTVEAQSPSRQEDGII